MDYKKIYKQLVERCKLRGLDKEALEGYYEKHHILPRCLGGGDEHDNLVLLTSREHVLAHRLLWKANPENNSLMWAYVMTRRFRKDVPQTERTNKTVAAGLNRFLTKQVFSEEALLRIGAASKGRIKSPETKAKWRAKNIGKRRSDEFRSNLSKTKKDLYASGWEMSEESKAALSKSLTGRKLTDEHRRNIGLGGIGRVVSEETKQKHSERMKALRPWERSQAKVDLYHRKKWEDADELHTLWKESGEVGSWTFTHKVNEVYSEEYSMSHFHTLVKLFKEGWTPTEDVEWLEFKELIADGLW